MNDPTNTTPTPAPEWAQRVTIGLLDASRHGRGDGRLTTGEQMLLDYLFLSVRQRAGVLVDNDPLHGQPWADVIAATWRTAVEAVEAERAQS